MQQVVESHSLAVAKLSWDLLDCALAAKPGAFSATVQTPVRLLAQYVGSLLCEPAVWHASPRCTESASGLNQACSNGRCAYAPPHAPWRSRTDTFKYLVKTLGTKLLLAFECRCSAQPGHTVVVPCREDATFQSQRKKCSPCLQHL